MAKNPRRSRRLRTKLKPLYAMMLPLMVFGMGLATSAQAVDETYNVDGGNWSTGGNWLDNSAPVSDNALRLIFSRSTTTSTTHDLGNLTLNRFSPSTAFGGSSTITIDAASGADILTFDGTTPLFDITSAAVDQFSTKLNVPVVLNQTLTVQGTAGKKGSVDFSGNVSGTGGLTVTNNAEVIFRGVGGVTYGGTTTIDSGTRLLSIYDNNSLSINSAHIINGELFMRTQSSIGSLSGSGTLSSDSNSTKITIGALNTSTTFSGRITGLGSFAKTGTGTLTLTGTNTRSGGITISAGTLQIGDGGTTGSIAGNTTNNGALIFNRSNASSYAGNITGTGSFTQAGTGSTNLTGANTYSGATTINAGTLYVNGSNAGSTSTVNAGGTLGGTGTVGSVFVNGGTFAPGNSIGTINVAGSVDFSAGGTYKVEVDAAGNSDLINATGSAILTNGVVEVLPEAGTYAYSTDYTILTAAGGLGGTTFNSVTSNFAFLDPTLSYDANNVFLNLTRNDSDFSSVASTPNQFAVATVITANKTPLTSIVSQVTPLSTSQAQSAFDSLSGVQHSVTPGIYNTLMQRFLQLIRVNRGGNGFANAEVATGLNSGDDVAKDIYWWGKGFTGNGDIDRDGTIAGMGYRNNGLTFGVDMSFNNHWRLGLAGSYANSDINGGGNDTDVDSYQLATYANWQQDDWYADMAIGYAMHYADSDRRVTVGVLTGIANADYDSDTMAASIEIGKRFQLQNKLNLTPFVGLEYSNTDRDSFTETGSFANLIVSSEKHESIRSKLGVKLDKVFKTAKGTQYTPSASLTYVHEHGDENNLMKAAFSAAPATSFRVEGNDQDRDRLQLDLGLTASINSRTQIDVSYVGEFANSDDYHSLNATVRVQW